MRAAVAQASERRRVRLPTGTSIPIRDVISLIRQVAQYESNVLVLGESGTGKEVCARAIHDLSPRRDHPFVAVNCGAIPADLLESELFGHEKGAFTGAVSSRQGRFEIAEGGTLFLDEIGDMSPAMQVKLLRVLQERVFERVGNQTPIRCNVRIIAATHRNLEESIALGTFREDLFHRLNVFPIEMPPLRSRIEDLPLLVRDFIAHNISEGRWRVQLSQRALGALALYHWPGNVRELGNLIERLSIVCGGRIAEVQDLPPKYRAGHTGVTADTDPIEVTQSTQMEDDEVIEELLCVAESLPPQSEALARLPPGGMDLRSHLLAIERHLIQQALDRAGGTVARAARLLNLRRTTLVEKLRKFGLLRAGTTTED